MPYLYILKNGKHRYYTGITKLLPFDRLLRHNKGGVYSTRTGRPWEIIYSKNFNSFNEARESEKLIKSWKGGNAFKKFLAKAAGSSNGRTAAFEAVNLGSNPSPAALAGNKIRKFGGVK